MRTSTLGQKKTKHAYRATRKNTRGAGVEYSNTPYATTQYKESDLAVYVEEERIVGTWDETGWVISGIWGRYG